MAYDEGLAQRVRDELATINDVDERRMFGGLAFMVRGHMAVGVLNDDLLARTGPEKWESALKRPHARVMDFTGRPMKGMVWVNARGCERDSDLRTWIKEALAFVQSLPPKAAKAPKPRKKTATRRPKA